MAGLVFENEDGEPELKLDTQGALADIGYNSIIASEQATSSEDEALEERAISADDAQQAVGVSISREQTRLTSPTTPAVEKAAAIQKAGGYFGGFDGTEDALVEEAEEDDDNELGLQEDKTAVETDAEEVRPARPWPADGLAERSARRTEVGLPSPWRVEPTANWTKHSRPKSGLFDGLFNRRRASTGPEPSSEGWQRSLLSSLPSLPSMPKNFSLSSAFSGSNYNGQALDTETSKPAILSTATGRQRAESDGRMPGLNQGMPREAPEETKFDSRRLSVQTDRSRTGLLRRSTSDHSLYTQRTLSRVESLGDDSRFEDVHDQVNSRFRAIKDSWQDANIKFPGVPNLKVANFASDLLRERPRSIEKRQSIKPVANEAYATHSTNPSRPLDPMTRQAYPSARAVVSEATAGKTITHPHFHRAMEQLEGDVVILGGYRGSVLRSAEPPQRQVWVPVKVGLNIRKVNLEVGFEDGDDARAIDSIIPGGMLTHIGPVDISRRLFKRLRSCENARTGKLRVRDYGYDWRLLPDFLSTQLIRYLETLPCNRPDGPQEKRGATVIAHSLGGLITRHAVNRRPDLFRAVVYAGVPHTCVNILGPLRNGDEVLLSSRVLTAQVNFSIRTSFALLPLDGRCFFDKETKEQYPVDFFDVNTWVDLRLSPCVARPLPPLRPQPKPTGITGYVSTMTSILPSLPLRGRKDSNRTNDISSVAPSESTVGLNMVAPDNTPDAKDDADRDDSVRTAVTIPREKALEYLERTLPSVKQFKQDLAFIPKHAEMGAYPPIAVIYGKSTPTVYGARVNGREGIKHADAYDDLAFASGDGVVLARSAMAPEGYKVARGGIIASDRGHVTLLGDLEAVGRALCAVMGSKERNPSRAS